MVSFGIVRLLLLLGLAANAVAQQIVLAPSTKQAVAGTISSQALTVLAVKDQSGTQNNWSSYVEVAAGTAKTFVAQFNFNYGGNPAGITGMTLLMNSMGLAKSEQTRTVQVLRSGVWTNIATNAGALGWQWYSQSVALTGPFSSYFQGGQLKVRISSNNKKDVMDLDYLVVQLTTVKPPTKAPVKPPTRAPVKPPTRAPVKAPIRPPTKSPSLPTAVWQPKASAALTWQLQLSVPVDISNVVNVNVYDIDLFDNSASQIQALKNQGRKVICYFSAGSYEGWRSDWQAYFPFITGSSYSGNEPPFAGKMAEWDERWLDIRRIDLLEPIMTARIQLAIDKGCDAVDPDNMDAYTNGGETGIPLTAQDQLNYNRWIANKAHAMGIAVGLKNDVDQLSALVDYYDFAVNEQCFQYNECGGYTAFTNKDKAVFGVEYEGSPAVFCPDAKSRKLSWQLKKLDLAAWRVGCETL